MSLSEKAVVDLAESGELPAYKVGGVFLRFKKEQVYEYRKKTSLHHKDKSQKVRSFIDRFKDFTYFNDFYFLALLLIAILLFIILKGY